MNDPRIRDINILGPALAVRLAGPLPGAAAHMAMAPRPRRFWVPGVVPDELRPAAALLLAYPRGGLVHVALTVRSRNLPSHRGQVSLPGGAVDQGESLEQAALREAREEVGFDDPDVRVHGVLTPLHIPVSGFALHPVVATTGRTPVWRPSPREVERVVEPALHDLADPRSVSVETWVRDGRHWRVPVFRVAGEVVWGATAMVLAEFLDLLDTRPDPWRGEPDSDAS